VFCSSTLGLVPATAVVDDVFRALADPTRRGVLERLEHGPTSTGELLRSFAMTLPSFTHHLVVLEDAGLVTSTKQGRVRTYRLAPGGLAVAEGWLAARRRHWEQRLDQLDLHLRETKEHTT
jgi:DNA-binding transcriptional ArsR family regulator